MRLPRSGCGSTKLLGDEPWRQDTWTTRVEAESPNFVVKGVQWSATLTHPSFLCEDCMGPELSGPDTPHLRIKYCNATVHVEIHAEVLTAMQCRNPYSGALLQSVRVKEGDRLEHYETWIHAQKHVITCSTSIV